MRFVKFFLAATPFFLFCGHPLAAAPRVLYSFTVWVHRDAEHGIDTTSASKILSTAQAILCRSCFGEQECPIQFKLDGEVQQFWNELVPKPVLTSGQARGFLDTEPRRRWGPPPRVKTEIIRRQIYLVDKMADDRCKKSGTEGDGTEFPLRGCSNYLKQWSLIDTRSSSRTEQWFRSQAVLWVHELGHNLGLGHVDIARNIMQCELGASDIEFTRRQCNMHSRRWRVRQAPPPASCDAKEATRTTGGSARHRIHLLSTVSRPRNLHGDVQDRKSRQEPYVIENTTIVGQLASLATAGLENCCHPGGIVVLHSWCGVTLRMDPDVREGPLPDEGGERFSFQDAAVRRIESWAVQDSANILAI